MKIMRILFGALASALLAGALSITASAEAGDVAIDETNFPDKNFRQCVLEECDKNGDKILSESEISEVVELDVCFRKISSLNGIENFSNLKQLDCSGNKLTSLNLSKNTALTFLNCGNETLTTLDVSNNTALTALYCGGSQLKSLDVSKNTELRWLECTNNQLTSLDVSNNAVLTTLTCYGNQFTSLDVSKNTKLTELYCGNNQLTSLDLSKNTKLLSLSCHNNKLTALNVSKNKSLDWLECWSNQLTSLDVSNNKELYVLRCYDNKLTFLDFNNNPHIGERVSDGINTDKDIIIYGKAGSEAETYAKENSIKFVAGKAPAESTKPTGLTAKSGNKQITLKWDAVSGATKYRVQRKTSDGWKTIARPKTNSYKHKGLKNGSTYTYRVSAYVDGKWGKPSAKIKAKAGA